MTRRLNFMLLLLLNQSKVTINHSKSRYYCFEDSQHLCKYKYEHEKKTEPDDKL